MPCMPSGELSGVYHIPVSGLPWSCTWQTLKDFARGPDHDGAQIKIERAHVFPGATDGYITVKGKDNFDKALAHLNGGVLENRALLADGRNKTGPVMIRDECSIATSKQYQYPSPIPTPPQSATDAFSPVTTPLPLQSDLDPEISSFTMLRGNDLDNQLYILPLTDYSSPPSPPEITHTANLQQPMENPQYFEQTYHHYGNIYQPCAAPFRHPPITPPGMNIVNNGYSQLICQIPFYFPARHPPPPTAQVVFSPAASYEEATYYRRPPPVATVVGPIVTDTSTVLSNNIKSESRKIIISRLPPTTTYRDLYLLLESLHTNLPITSQLARPASDIAKPSTSTNAITKNRRQNFIEHVELAKHTYSKSKGHAFVTFRTEEVALAMVGALSGMEWRGKALRAKFTKEGVRRRGILGERGEECQDKRSARSDARSGHGKEKDTQKEGEHIKNKVPAGGVTILKRPDAPMVVNGSGNSKV